MEFCKNIGYFRLNNRNDKGLEILNMLNMHDRYVHLTFFNHKKRVTWRSFNKEKIPFQLDQLIINLLDFALDSKVVNYWILSDHSDIQLKLKCSTKKKTMLNNLDNIDWILFLNTDIKKKINSRGEKRLKSYG